MNNQIRHMFSKEQSEHIFAAVRKSVQALEKALKIKQKSKNESEHIPEPFKFGSGTIPFPTEMDNSNLTDNSL